MAVTIDTSSIGITISDQGVKPVVTVENKKPFRIPGISFSGFAQVELSHTKQNIKRLEAFGAKGRVKFLLGPGDTLADWKVGFVQIVRQNSLRARYAGRFQDEGSIVCDPMPKVPSRVLMDALDAAMLPFYEPPDEKPSFKASVAEPSTADGPSIGVPLSMANHAVSSVDNFLFDFEQDTEFWTILTAIGPDKALQFLGHFHWRVVHKVGFLWRFRVAMETHTASSFKVLERFLAGQPTEPSVRSLLTSPKGPIANDTFVPAFNNSLKGGPTGDPEIHQESPQRFFGVPDFWWIE